MARGIRERALERIAALSASSTDRTDLERLSKACSTYPTGKGRDFSNGHYSGQAPSLGRVPMTIREFEVLLALCKAVPTLHSQQSAQRLVHQLMPYMLDAHSQTFQPSPLFRKVKPSASETLSFHVTAALLFIGNTFRDLQEKIADNIWSFLNSCSYSAEKLLPAKEDAEDLKLEDAIRTATLTLSLLGFMEAVAAQTDFWRSGGRLALVQRLRNILSDQFLMVVEASFSIIRNVPANDHQLKEWKRYLRHYAAAGRPLGAVLLQSCLSQLLVATTSLLVVDMDSLRGAHVLDVFMSGTGPIRPVTAALNGDGKSRLVEPYSTMAIELMNNMEANADFVQQLGSSSQQSLSFSVKCGAIVTYLNCVMVDDEVADLEVLMEWLEDILGDPIQMSNEMLASVVVRSMAVVCRMSPEYASAVSRLLPRFIVQSVSPSQIVADASRSLAFVLQMLSKDAVITTLYTLGNVLSPGTDRHITNGKGTSHGADQATNGQNGSAIYGRHSTGSAISLRFNGDHDTGVVYGNVVRAICVIAEACDDEKITALAQAMLLQKIDKVNSAVDAEIITGAAVIGLKGGQLEFRSLLKMYTRLCREGVLGNKEFLLDAVMQARNYISANLGPDSLLFDIYWEHLLDSIISMGDVGQSGHTKDADVQLAAREIAQLLHPLAVFMSSNDLTSDTITEDESSAMLRDAWFNIVVHGFLPSTDRGKKYMDELRVMAIHSPPLVAEQRGEQVESDIELNTVLRRGMSSEREAMQKKHLSDLIPSKASEIRSLSYRKVIFLQAAYLVESLRAEAGDCTKALSYFVEPSMRGGSVSSTMEAIASAVVDKYLKRTMSGTDASFSAQHIASQLATVFCSCCHRIERVQQAAYACADRIIRDTPSALCQRSSLFALLELLSLLWSSCLESETELYEPRSRFRSELGNVTIELSDDYDFRRDTLDLLRKKAKTWVSAAISLSPADVKGHLQTYLSEFADDGAYGHISMGRSFAIGLGSLVPSTDQMLQSVDQIGEFDINTASDFVAQYTSRQEYRYGEALPGRGADLGGFSATNRRSSLHSPALESANAATALAHVEVRILGKKAPPLVEVREILRRAAALLCRSRRDECAVAHYLVSIPFSMFTKESIKLGVSLWLGVMNENPRLEPRLLNEIAQQFEFTIQKRLGLFNPLLVSHDPFFLREEFAPSDLESLKKRRQAVHNTLSPHSRLIQFFGSHFNATRLGNHDTQKVFLRLIDAILDAVQTASTHPLTREIRLQILLLGLRVLRVSTTIGAVAEWRLKDKILSAGLSWFETTPQWSYGNNALQLKTEIRLLTDILAALKVVAFIGAYSVGNVRSLQSKEQLLTILLESEQARLAVWAYPMNGPPKAQMFGHTMNKSTLESTLIPLARTAWAQSPSIAIELVNRFPFPRLHREVRWLLLNSPSRAVSDAAALPILFGGSLAEDVTFMQLKYLLVWAPADPVTAATLFLPDYKDDPFIIQYAMKALESHPVEVTFFYVPQIVQTLRYDRLGYVERYILETAQTSQLFAHQIIWNMKANSYKDDDAQIEDAIKPTLDTVMRKMIARFSPPDRGFYEREFTFFDEVTSISGKLKPLIKRSKPEKKQKIEEELRKIKVEVGVYLPSNPDGVVIGIDRKSGKPMQSHAKAPFMATFRVKRPKPAIEAVEGAAAAEGAVVKETEAATADDTIELWQSAIFKVGDDCRQDVLALQLISAFRGIFHSVGLDVWVFPYRVTATAPGCGVIDVLPNSISRDMLGREAVNGLYDYFISKYGNEDSLRFQQARNNFVKSMAAYSVISFLLQFKDRHNGNIMINDQGHIMHIDFGFCFDIAPGGVRFERAPFKLTSEMLAVMGGSTDHQSFRWFEELCVKAFLASRQHCDRLAHIVLLMMDSGLPCFKPETVKHLRERFVLERTEREAAEFMRDLIRKSYASYSTGIYDQFQLLTNGIPY